jgi:hypothetical protein
MAAAISTMPHGTPFSEVVETYTDQVLSFAHQNNDAIR